MKAQNSLVVGTFGPLGEALARRLNASDGPTESLLYLRGPETQAPIGQTIEAVARVSESLKRIYLVQSTPASVDGMIAEDALRYLALQRRIPLVALRVNPDVSCEEALARLAAEESGSPMPRKPSAVLVTGAAGQIGRGMTRLLDERGIPHRDVDIVAPAAGAPFLKCDLADPAGLDGLAEFCRPVTHVIHLVSRISNAKSLAEDYREQFRLNVEGTRNLIRALPAELRHFSFASSMTVYGNTQVALVDETHPVQPNCIYALCKLACERSLTEFGLSAGVPVALLRYTSAYGPGPVTGRAIPAMIARALDGEAPQVFGEGSARRDYIYVDDLCRATLQATLREADGVFNIGTGAGISAAELAELVARLCGGRVQPVRIPRALDAQAASSLVFDIGKMRRELDFSPRFSLEQGLLETIRHIQAARGGRTHEERVDVVR